VRLEQVQALLADLGQPPATVIMGDFNATRLGRLRGDAGGRAAGRLVMAGGDRAVG
jgi:endonuclease/exonuclease/phosphatase family metal-dependent hydrolase